MKRECKTIRILYVQTNEIGLLDIPRALDELGYDVYKAQLGIRAQGFHDEDCERLALSLRDIKPDYAISYDFAQSIAQACFEENVPYISWVYDSPQTELYTHYAFYPSNYIFVFDKMQQKRLKDIGIQNVFYMPLAIHAKKVQKSLELSGGFNVPYENEIGFVGQLYYVEKLENILKEAPEHIRTTMEELIQRCFLKWDNETWMHGSMSEDCVEYYSAIDNHRIPELCPYITEQFSYEAAVLSRHIANRERTHILNTLAEKYDVALYTLDKNTKQLNNKVRILPGVSYDREVSKIYLQNKINLNITLHCIETGASQRIFDVMAAGGFMMSNYQQELAELFVPGKEIVLYHNMQELEELVEYYLTHDEERERIARNGQKKVLECHNYHEKLQNVIQFIEKEDARNGATYMEQQHAWLKQQAEELLSQHSEGAYCTLHEIFGNRQYETVIRKTTALGLLREMLNCWRREHAMGMACIFEDVENLEQAEEKYLLVKHGMWRIEQRLSDEACRAGVERMQIPTISKYFMAWVVRANLEHTDETLVELSAYLAEYDVLEGIELLNYGLIFYPKSPEILLQKANYLMDLNAWKEALETLWEIEEPTIDVINVIQDLQNALGMER